MKINTNSNSVFDIRISPDQKMFACSLIDAPLKIYSLESGELLASHADINGDSSWSLDWLKYEEQEFVISGYGTTGYIRIIDCAGNDKLTYAKKSPDFGYPNAAQLHSNSVWKIRVIGNQSFSVSDDGSFTRLDLEYNPEKGTFNYTRKLEKRLSIYGNLHDFCHFEDNQFLIAQREDIYSTPKNKFSASSAGLYLGHSNRVVSICKLNDTQFLSSSWDNTIKLWNIGKREPVRSIDVDDIGYNLTVLDAFVLHTSGKSIAVRKVENLELIKNIDVSDAALKCFDITTDRQTLIAGDEEGMAFVVNIADLMD